MKVEAVCFLANEFGGPIKVIKIMAACGMKDA